MRNQHVVPSVIGHDGSFTTTQNIGTEQKLLGLPETYRKRIEERLDALQRNTTFRSNPFGGHLHRRTQARKGK